MVLLEMSPAMLLREGRAKRGPGCGTRPAKRGGTQSTYQSCRLDKKPSCRPCGLSHPRGPPSVWHTVSRVTRGRDGCQRGHCPLLKGYPTPPFRAEDGRRRPPPARQWRINCAAHHGAVCACYRPPALSKRRGVGTNLLLTTPQLELPMQRHVRQTPQSIRTATQSAGSERLRRPPTTRSKSDGRETTTSLSNRNHTTKVIPLGAHPSK